MDSPTILGSGDVRYRLIPDRARLPEGWDVHEVAADARGDFDVGEVAKTSRGNLFPGVTPEKPSAVLQKLVNLA